MKDDQGSTGLETMQQWFGWLAPARGAKAPDLANFWRNQDKILDSMQEFTQGWFERRHEATRAAFDAARRSSEAQSPADIAREYQAWLTGSMQRVFADCLACQQHFTTVSKLSAAPAVGDGQASEPPSTPSDLGKDSGGRAKAA